MSTSKVISYVAGTAIPYLDVNVDTDEIAPTKEALFILSWKELSDAFCIKTRRQNPTHVLNDPRYAGAKILLAGANFGCGSSREHAAQAVKARYDAVIAPSFAPIFAGNCYSIGIPTITMDAGRIEYLGDIANSNPKREFTLDLDKLEVRFGMESLPLELEESKRQGFLRGEWDEVGALEEGLKDNLFAISHNLPSLAGYQNLKN